MRHPLLKLPAAFVAILLVVSIGFGCPVWACPMIQRGAKPEVAPAAPQRFTCCGEPIVEEAPAPEPTGCCGGVAPSSDEGTDPCSLLCVMRMPANPVAPAAAPSASVDAAPAIALPPFLESDPDRFATPHPVAQSPDDASPPGGARGRPLLQFVCVLRR